MEREITGNLWDYGKRENNLKGGKGGVHTVSDRATCHQINNKLQFQLGPQSFLYCTCAENEHDSRYFYLCNYCFKPRALLYNR